MKGLRGDVLSAAAVLSVPLALALAFPREALTFAASQPEKPSVSSDSIVFLDSAAAAGIVRSAKVLPRADRSGMVLGLLPAELPGPDASMMMALDLGDRAARPSVVESGLLPFLPSRRAEAPVRIPGGEAVDELPFPRKELLKLN